MVCSIVATSPCSCRPRNARASRIFHITRAAGSSESDYATSRRVGLVAWAGGATALLQLQRPGISEAAVDRTDYVPMEALKDKDYGKTPMKYKDYVMTESGLQYQDLKMGQGQAVTRGQELLIDWDGYTVGYYGRVFEARNKPKGSSFSGDDKEFFRFRLGDEKVIAAINEAVEGMRVGGIRRLIVPESLGYVGGDWRKWGPSPTTFAGKRTLDFVLQNRGMIDKTLLMDVEIIKAY